MKLSHGEQRSFDYLLRPEPYLWGGGAVTLAVENFAIRRGDEEFTLNRRMEAVVKPVDQTLDAFYLSACYGRPMDKQLTETFDERLWIAKLLLLRRGSSIIVDRVLPPPFGQYSYNAQQLMLLRELEEYYPAPRGEAEAPPAGRTAEAPAVSAPEPGGLRSTACGVFNLSLGLGADQKGPAFSEEIMHGLGKGPVYVDVGVEYIDAASEPGGSGEILLGNVSLFKSDAPAGGEERIYNLSTAVKVLPERGTFVVAVSLEKPDRAHQPADPLVRLPARGALQAAQAAGQGRTDADAQSRYDRAGAEGRRPPLPRLREHAQRGLHLPGDGSRGRHGGPERPLHRSRQGGRL